MKKLVLLLFVICYSISAFSQENIFTLKSGTFKTDNYFDLNISDNSYRMLFFNKIPNNKEKNELENIGVDFLYYLPRNIFVVNLNKYISKNQLESYSIVSTIKIKAEYKIDQKLQNNNFPEWALKNNQLHIKLLLFKDVIISDVLEEIRDLSQSMQDVNEFSNSVRISITPSNLSLFSELNYVSYIEAIDPPSEKENHEGRTLHRSNVINTNFSAGRHYDGSGINIMMQDDGIIGPHIDYNGRVDQSHCSGCSASNSNDHGDHVAGTIMGAGNIDPQAAGMANGAFLYVFSSSNNNYYDVPTIYQNNDVVITSKSYSNGCNAGYTSLSKDLDEQINLYPSLMHVFSAGNDGNSDCGYGAGSGWGNVTGGHKQAKNVIAVANLNSLGNLASSSSRGPAEDGRIKPDISSKGTSVYSTVPEYNYDHFTGTSMACPGIAGVMAQLYQAYKELNSGQNPNSALMKCLLLNSADDIGNPGPDFKHGWGEVNAFRSIKILENNQYFSSVISQQTSNLHNITIPSGVNQIKIMTYWNDKEASTAASISLVNDINSHVSFLPLGIIYNPLVLDETPTQSALNSYAAPGIDALNNIEQIIIDNPIPGTYTLYVDGFSIPFGPQEYWVTYEFITDEVELTYPIGGEGFSPGESEIIRWDASESTTSFSLEYTTDGISWNTIASSINPDHRYYTWMIPNVVTNQAKVRITRGSSSDESVESFVIINVPQNIIVDWICPDSIYMSWDPVAGATSYEVSMLGSVYMDSMITSVTTNSFFLNPNPSVVDSWFSVCAKINIGKGRRAVAINQQPTNIGCIAPPTAIFSAFQTTSCSGEISFYDNSHNQPNNWVWDFGDGATSNLQNPTHTYLTEGTFSVQLIVSNNLGIDSIIQLNYITIDFLPGPIAYNDTICANSASFVLNSASNNVRWYPDTLGSSYLFNGSPFITPVLSSTTNYYIREFGVSPFFGGPADYTIGSGSYYQGNRHLIFDSYVSCKLISSLIYADTSNVVTFELRDSSGGVIDDTTLAVIPGSQTIYLNFDIPVGNDLQLGINGVNSGLFRNNNGASFPYDVGNLVSFTGASNSSTQNNWYFYYNIQIMENCKSDFTEVTAFLTPPISSPPISQIGNVLSVTNNPSYSYQWYLNGNIISGANSNSYAFTIPGNYYLEISYMGCISISDPFIISSVNNDLKEISIYPNPATSIINIESINNIDEIRIFDIQSRVIFSEEINSKNKRIDIENFSSGVYFIEIITNNIITRKEFVISHDKTK